jgi:hypothetical protein
MNDHPTVGRTALASHLKRSERDHAGSFGKLDVVPDDRAVIAAKLGLQGHASAGTNLLRNVSGKRRSRDRHRADSIMAHDGYRFTFPTLDKLHKSLRPIGCNAALI